MKESRILGLLGSEITAAGMTNLFLYRSLGGRSRRIHIQIQMSDALCA